MTAKRVLLVDDEPGILNILKLGLEEEGFECFTATSAKDALEIFKRNKIEFVLSDRKMAGMGGIEFLIEIRKTSKVPFFLLSGELRIEEDMIAIKLGASNIIRKPFDLDLITQLLKKVS